MEKLAKGDEVAVICEHGFVVFGVLITYGQKTSGSALAGKADTGSGYTSERTFGSLDLLGTPEHVRHMWPRNETRGGTFSASECGCALAPPAKAEKVRLERLKHKRK